MRFSLLPVGARREAILGCGARRLSGAAMFAHSRKDLLLVALGLLMPALVFADCRYFDQLGWISQLTLAAVVVGLIGTNYQCVGHNFVHNPFFRRPLLNHAFSLVNSLSLGMPQTLYKYHHLNHHRFNNDKKRPGDLEPRDRSSTYRFAAHPEREESLLAYAFLGPFRTELRAPYREAKARRRAWLACLEWGALAGFSVSVLLAEPKCFFFFLLPVWYGGQVFALAENWLEHHRATPGNRLADSVSCYGRLYNLIWFNNGYHQEHHFRPTVHWTKIADVRGEMLPEEQRQVVLGAHWFNWRPRSEGPASLAAPGRAGCEPFDQLQTAPAPLQNAAL
jgi:fatty acid desaturase